MFTSKLTKIVPMAIYMGGFADVAFSIFLKVYGAHMSVAHFFSSLFSPLFLFFGERGRRQAERCARMRVAQLRASAAAARAVERERGGGRARLLVKKRRASAAAERWRASVAHD
jgi:hypothetical protein